MKIGIHETKGFFSDRWIAYCDAKGISYKIVNCYSSDIIRELSDCDALMWHFNHKSPKASKFAKQLLFSIQSSGKKVFPDYNTVWHFDDKVGQKYLLEAISAPMAPAYAFYSKREALEWANQTNYPKVFKLRNGAGSDNVRLVRSRGQAKRLINKAFNRGFKQYRALDNLKERYRKYQLGKTTFWDVTKGIIRLVHTTEYSRVGGREVGYIYFQDFIPGNDHDIRVVVIEDKAFAIKRMVRKNDFRASGSGNILYDKHLFDNETIKLAFDLAAKLQTQCVAFDFVKDNNVMLLVEISYGFSPNGYDPCPGFWEKDLTWKEGPFNPYGWMVENLIKSLKEGSTIQGQI
jgi:glutathione synthase/RimK-type ligase-like ATP-grasp enzyme